MKERIKQFKQIKKDIDKQIKEMKSRRKDSENGYVEGLLGLRHRARHIHIAYCQMKGRSYEEIEKKIKEGNKPDMEYVEFLLWQSENPIEKIEYWRWLSNKRNTRPLNHVSTSISTSSQKQVGLLQKICSFLKGN